MPNMFFVCVFNSFFFFFNDTATTEIYTLSLHDALPITLRLAQDEAAVDVLAEWRYYDSYVALVEPSLRAALDAWIAAHPRVVEARIARGMYFVNLAGVRRGGAVAGRTKRAQFGALDATLDSSFAEIRVALKGDPSNLAAYWVLQRAAGFHGQADVLPTYNRALRLSPASFVTRWLAITNLAPRRSEEHTSELQSQSNLVCRLLLEKKKKTRDTLLATTVSRV